MDAARQQAFEKLQININHRAILCLDGGGMRGILTIQLLKKLEETAGLPCYQLFDMVAGTSTGGIIAGLIASGHSAPEIETLYENLVTQVFDKRFLGNRFVNPPAFTKEKYRELLKGVVNDATLQDTCSKTDIDLMITSQDLAAGEETFFSCFKQTDGSFYGTYKDVLLRAAMETTMSAPTYFYPLERFVDGGTTTYNNPSLAAFMEAVSYSSASKTEDSFQYKVNQVCLFSFGTGISRQFIKPEQTTTIKDNNIVFWLNWIMTATGQDASAMQVDVLRSPMVQAVVDFRRFQISLDPASMGLLDDVDTLDETKYHTKSLHALTTDVLGNIDMADVTRFDLMQTIGTQMATYIVKKGGAFTKDLANDKGRDTLVSAFGDIATIQKQLASAAWLDGFKA